MTTFYAGDSVILTTESQPFALADTPTVPADPTTIAMTVIDPAGTSSTYTYALGQVTKVSTGVYRKTVACPITGRWRANIVGGGAVSKTAKVYWDVHDPL